MPKDVTVSSDANRNYLAKVVEIKMIRPHANADRLQVVNIDNQDVITGMQAMVGDIYVFFPLECQINAEFLQKTNAYRDKTLNADPNAVGFFESTGRVRAVKLRGERSMGYIVPVQAVELFAGVSLRFSLEESFDTLGNILMCKKFEVPRQAAKEREARSGRKPRISRLVANQVRLHLDTYNLRNMVSRIHPTDEISITYKTHGTSWWVANVLTKRKLRIHERVLRVLGVAIQDTAYDYVYGSRKVVKNEYETQGMGHYYGTDLWADIKDMVKEKIPKGYTLYGEALGYTKGGAPIQKGYDYGCKPGEMKIQVYRVTYTNADGLVRDLSTKEAQDFCTKAGLEFVQVLYTGTLADIHIDHPYVNEELDPLTVWRTNMIKYLEEKYTDKYCHLCTNKVPEEGIVVRKEVPGEFEAYKLKSYKFLQYETKLLDEGVSDLESEN